MCHSVAGLPSKARTAAPFSALVSWLSVWIRDQADGSTGAEEGRASAAGMPVPVAATVKAPAFAPVLTESTPERSAGSKNQPEAAAS